MNALPACMHMHVPLIYLPVDSPGSGLYRWFQHPECAGSSVRVTSAPHRLRHLCSPSHKAFKRINSITLLICLKLAINFFPIVFCMFHYDQNPYCTSVPCQFFRHLFSLSSPIRHRWMGLFSFFIVLTL